MGDWTLEIAFHFPHNRFMLGWEHIPKDERFTLHNNKTTFIYSNTNTRFLTKLVRLH